MQSPRTLVRDSSHQQRPPTSSSVQQQPAAVAAVSRDARPTINLHCGTHCGSSVWGAYTAGRADLDGAAQHALLETPVRKRTGWIDDDYLERNPWHDNPKRKPIFSLGQPLPRLVRGPREVRVKNNVANKNRPLEELAERGELKLATPTPTSGLESSSQFDHVLSTQTSSQPEHTANGTAHNDRHNAAGQPVFEDIPVVAEQDQHVQNSREEDATSTASYKIDSEPLGKTEHDDYGNGERDLDELRNWWARLRAKHPEPLAEFLSTGVAIYLGLAGTLSVNLSQNESLPYGSYETSCWAWGFAWMFGVYIGGGVSGAHMNPAISVSLSLFRGFPWRQCIMYCVVQFIAAVVAGALAYGCYADTIYYMDSSLENTSKAFVSKPQSWVSAGDAFLNQSVGSAIMTTVVFALGDDQNNPPGAGMHAFVLGLLVAILKMALRFNVGSALNPASDFGPRLIAYAVGYHQESVFKDLWWLYGPWAATFIGSILGCVIYDTFVFVGTESPVNYRYPPTIWRKIEKKGRQIKQKGHQVLNHLSRSNDDNDEQFGAVCGYA